MRTLLKIILKFSTSIIVKAKQKKKKKCYFIINILFSIFILLKMQKPHALCPYSD